MGLISKIEEKLTGGSKRDEATKSEPHQTQTSSLSNPFTSSTTASDNTGLTSSTSKNTADYNSLAGGSTTDGSVAPASSSLGTGPTTHSDDHPSSLPAGSTVGAGDSTTSGSNLHWAGTSTGSSGPTSTGSTLPVTSSTGPTAPTTGYGSGHGITSGPHASDVSRGSTVPSTTSGFGTTGLTSGSTSGHGITSGTNTHDNNTGLTSSSTSGHGFSTGTDTRDNNTGLTSASTSGHGLTTGSSTHDNTTGLDRSTDRSLDSTRAGGNTTSAATGTALGGHSADSSKPVVGAGPDTGPVPAKENTSAIPTAGGQKVGTGVDDAETAYGARPIHGEEHHSGHNHGHSHEHHHSHTARDATLATGTGAGLATVGGHGLDKKHEERRHQEGLTSPTLPTSSGLSSQPDPTGPTSSSLSSEPQRQFDPALDQRTGHYHRHHEGHHHGRDAAIGAGVGTAGLAAYEAGKDRDSSQTSTLPGQRTSALGSSTGPSTGTGLSGTSHSGTSGNLTQRVEQLVHPTQPSSTDRSAGEPYLPQLDFQSGGLSRPTQGTDNLTGSGLPTNTSGSSELPHRQKHSHLGTDAALGGGAGALAGAGLFSDIKHHERRHDSGNQHVLPLQDKSKGSGLSGISESGPAHVAGLRHAQTVGGDYESGYRAALAHLNVNTDGLL